MEEGFHGEILVDDLGMITCRITRTFPHLVDRVWKRLTDRRHLHEWLTSEPGGIIRPHKGGEVNLPTISGATIRSTVLAVEPEQFLSFLWQTDDWIGGIVAWILVPASDRQTLMLFNHTDQGIGSDHAVRAMANWHMSLDMLASSLAGTPVAWNWDAWQAFVVHYETTLATHSGELL